MTFIFRYLMFFISLSLFSFFFFLQKFDLGSFLYLDNGDEEQITELCVLQQRRMLDYNFGQVPCLHSCKYTYSGYLLHFALCVVPSFSLGNGTLIFFQGNYPLLTFSSTATRTRVTTVRYVGCKI